MEHGEIRTYKLRRSRVTAAQAAALAAHSAHFQLDPAAPLPPQPWCSQYAKLVLEIGFGMGEAAVHYAQLQPDTAILAADLHTPGVGRLLADLAATQIENVRVVEADALQLLRHTFSGPVLDGVRIFFPDPWPKARHHKRRLVNPANLHLIASRVRQGGFLHFATDWSDYAESAREVIAGHTDWQLQDPVATQQFAATRPLTKFAERGIAAGRSITDLVALRV